MPMECCSRSEYQCSVAFTSILSRARRSARLDRDSLPRQPRQTTSAYREDVRMGEDVAARDFSREDRQRYREKLRACLDVFARMLSESRFDFERPLTGLEIEFNLVDEDSDPAMRNAEVLDAIADADFQTELGQFNIEINVRPRSLVGGEAETLETE